MNIDDKEALNELLRGAGFCVGVIGLLLVFVAIFGTFEKTVEDQTVTTKGKFEVVDSYKGCDVVQWHYGALAEYKYFLHCPR